MDFLSRFLGKGPGSAGQDNAAAMSDHRENGAAEQSPNKKGVDKSTSKNGNQLTSRTNETVNEKSNASDESSDSSLDYGSANEDSSPRDDIPCVATTDIKIKPNTAEKHNEEATLSFIENAEAKSVIKHKQKIFNPLTESFETPNSTILDTTITNKTVNADICEVGEDPLELSQQDSMLDFKMELTMNDQSMVNSSSVDLPEFKDDEIKHTLSEESFNQNTTGSYSSNETRVIDDDDNRQDRESSVEVLHDINEFLKTCEMENDYDESTPVENSPYESEFNKLLKMAVDKLVNDDHDDLPQTNLLEDTVTFVDDDEENIEHSPNRRRDSGASIFVIHSGNSNDPENILSSKIDFYENSRQFIATLDTSKNFESLKDNHVYESEEKDTNLEVSSSSIIDKAFSNSKEVCDVSTIENNIQNILFENGTQDFGELDNKINSVEDKGIINTEIDSSPKQKKIKEPPVNFIDSQNIESENSIRDSEENGNNINTYENNDLEFDSRTNTTLTDNAIIKNEDVCSLPTKQNITDESQVLTSNLPNGDSETVIQGLDKDDNTLNTSTEIHTPINNIDIPCNKTSCNIAMTEISISEPVINSSTSRRDELDDINHPNEIVTLKPPEKNLNDEKANESISNLNNSIPELKYENTTAYKTEKLPLPLVNKSNVTLNLTENMVTSTEFDSNLNKEPVSLDTDENNTNEDTSIATKENIDHVITTENGLHVTSDTTNNNNVLNHSDKFNLCDSHTEDNGQVIEEVSVNDSVVNIIQSTEIIDEISGCESRNDNHSSLELDSITVNAKPVEQLKDESTVIINEIKNNEKNFISNECTNEKDSNISEVHYNGIDKVLDNNHLTNDDKVNGNEIHPVNIETIMVSTESSQSIPVQSIVDSQPNNNEDFSEPMDCDDSFVTPDLSNAISLNDRNDILSQTSSGNYSYENKDPFKTVCLVRNSVEREIPCEKMSIDPMDISMENPFATRSQIRNSLGEDDLKSVLNRSNLISSRVSNVTPFENEKVEILNKSQETVIEKEPSAAVEEENLISSTVSSVDSLEIKNNEESTSAVDHDVKTPIIPDDNHQFKVPIVNETTTPTNDAPKIDEFTDDLKELEQDLPSTSSSVCSEISTDSLVQREVLSENNTERLVSSNKTDDVKVQEHIVGTSEINTCDRRSAVPDSVSVMSSVLLSPMSRCGDLMGMSPVAHPNKIAQVAPNVTALENDLLTRESVQDNDLDSITMDMDDDEFKSPDELFKDPAAFDFLLNCGNSSSSGAQKFVPARDFGKESLFVKFDPLVRSLPTGVRPGRESIPPVSAEEIPAKIDEDVTFTSGLAESCSSDSSVTGPLVSEQGKSFSTMSSAEQGPAVHSSQANQPLIASVPAIPHNGNLQLTDKPMQVVSPAKNLRSYQPSNPATPISSKFSTPVSPAIAAIDRLINLGLNTPPPPPVVVQPKEHEMDPQLLSELHSVKDLLSSQEHELQQANERLASLQQQLSESNEREQALIERVNEKNRNHRQMSVVMEEYERTMAQIISEREVEKRQWLEERAVLVRERDEVSSHLANIEHSFNDTHVKYERCKTVIQTYKSNEEILKQAMAKQDENLKKLMERYDQLRQHAMSQLDKANQEIDSVKKSSQAEIIKYQAMLKKSEIQISSLQESLAQKTKNCDELTAICDELINKVG